MKISTKIICCMAILVLSIYSQVYSYEISDYLITTDIGSYLASKKTGGGKGPGILSGVSHFYYDHEDNTYANAYFNLSTDVGPEVFVTQHFGYDSDKWLLHELEGTFRGIKQKDFLGKMLLDGATVREVENNKIFDYEYVDYRWISNNVIIRISYKDLKGNKPEPLEVLKAYLQKFPSTIQMTDVEAHSRSHNEKWIKDEMSRRLWLGDKWSGLIKPEDAELRDKLKNTVESLTVFLNYRKKYFGVAADSDAVALQDFLDGNSETAIRAKLTEYKEWWAAHKSESISLP